MRQSLATAACGLALCLAGAAAASAQGEESPAQFFLGEQQRMNQPAVPARPRVHHAAPSFGRPRMARPAMERRPLPRTANPAPKTAPRTIVAVFGDRLGEMLASGLDDGSKGGFAVESYTSDEDGLTRPDFPAWLAGLRDGLKTGKAPAAAVVMLGGADWRPISDGDKSAEAGTPRWLELYDARVDAVAAAFRDARVPLIWVGLPSVRSSETSGQFVRLNGILRDRAEHDGASFIDVWEGFIDEGGRFSPVGPDVDGDQTRLRKADGFGFTRAGALKLASFVMPDLKRHLHGDGASDPVASIAVDRSPDFDQALDVDINAQIRREAGLEGSSAIPRTTPSEAKPAVGPVLSLTDPPLAPNGQLATASHTDSGAEASLATRPSDVTGSVATAKPGRADDFSWPKP